jgi:anion-transporting  ArsA/GET3 family ATPase
VHWEDLFGRQILIVSGKGGTGKSTIAAALASVAAHRGIHTLLVEVEGRGEIARTLQISDPGFREVRTAFGFSVLSVTPQEAVAEYLHLFLGMDRVTRPLLRAGALEQVIGGAPGFRDLLSCGKLYELAHLRGTDPRVRGRPQYSLIVVDAPPTGQIAAFLSSASAFADLARVGRIKRQATAIDGVLRRKAQVLLVAAPEEMSVAETEEAIPAIRKIGVPVIAVAVNRCLPPVFPRGTRQAAGALSPEDVVGHSKRAGLSISADQARALLGGAAIRDRRHALHRRFVKALGRTGPTLELPEMPGLAPGETVSALVAVMRGEPNQTAESVELPDEASPRRPLRAASRGREVTAASGPGLEERLAERRIVVVCGSGGVGKTTIAAAVAIHLAGRRSRTALLTVDPARRLATSLGLPRVAGERAWVELGRGRRMEAMQLDTQRTFDGLIQRHAGNAERRERILSNRFYQRISDTLAGTHEYMAMEKLYELAMEEDHDAIVIDTPPTRSALSFLDAPTRLNEFLGGRALRWMLWPSARAGRLTLGVARLGAQAFARTAGRLVGAEVLADTADFLAAFEGMYGGFRSRAAKVLELLRSPECAFLIVTTPTTVSLEEAGYFVERLGQAGMHPLSAVANRWHPEADTLPRLAQEAAERLSSGDAAERATAAVLADRLRRERQHRSEAAAMNAFAERYGAIPITPIPELAEDVHDVPGLRRVGAHLFESRG